MTQYFNFVPSTSVAPQFQPTLDDQVYNAIMTWNLDGQRYYINLYQLDGTLVFCLPLVGSESGTNIVSLTWNQGVVTATTETPHGYAFGATMDLTISGATPDGYNGLVSAFVTGASTFTYLLPAFPGAATIAGRADFNINLAAGYFSSTLVFRQASQQFEVNP